MEFYNKISEFFNFDDAKTSDFFHKLGIKGMQIKTLSQEDKKYNYVVFNENDVEIIKKESKEQLIIYKINDINMDSENKENIEHLLSIVPTGMKMSHVKDYLFYNGITNYFNNTDKIIFINKLDSEYLLETEKIKKCELFTSSTELEAREIENIYIKSFSELTEEIDGSFEIVKDVNLNDFKTIIENKEVEFLEKNIEQNIQSINTDNNTANQKEQYEAVTRFKVII